MNSRFYTGTVRHERLGAVKNRFHYGIYYLYADLDELDELDTSLSWFSHNHRGWFALYDVDHGPLDGTALKPWFVELASRAGIDLTGGRVTLLTFPRVLGFKFYPVSFWYAWNASGELVCILAEVQNTYREHHGYLLHDHGRPMSWDVRPQMRKELYVSPLLSMDGRYEFRFSEPGERLRLGIYDFIEGPLTMVASLDLEQRPLTDAELRKALLRFGPMSLRAGLLIVWQALRIKLKGARYYSKPAPPEEGISL